MIIAAVALMACVTPDDRLVSNATTCQSWGFPAGTAPFLDCVTKLTALDARTSPSPTIGGIGRVLTSTARGIRAGERRDDYPVPQTYRSGATEAIDREIMLCLRRGAPPSC
jgi:hypothetical protein